jgi:hypothetical protein
MISLLLLGEGSGMRVMKECYVMKTSPLQGEVPQAEGFGRVEYKD